VGAHPVGRPVDGHDDSLVEKAIEDRGGEHRVTEASAPAGDAGVGGDDGGGFEVAAEITSNRAALASGSSRERASANSSMTSSLGPQ
jgi:hypothetical protein